MLPRYLPARHTLRGVFGYCVLCRWLLPGTEPNGYNCPRTAAVVRPSVTGSVLPLNELYWAIVPAANAVAGGMRC